MKSILLFAGCLLPYFIMAQAFNEKIHKELSFSAGNSQPVLMIVNINGDVKVESYEGNKVVVDVSKQIYGKSTERLNQGKSEIQLGVIDRADTIILFVDGLCNKFGRQGKQWSNEKRYGGWGYNWNSCEDHTYNYDWQMDFTVKVPAGVTVMARTINNGDVEIRDVKGYTHAENVNGSIKLQNISGATFASTINGDVDIDYQGNPNGECRYYTLNGDINAIFKKGLSADLAFQSFNGDLYTNVSDVEALPMELQKVNDKEGVRYKVGGSRFRIGRGGPLLDVETFNGNAYIKEK